MSLDRLSELRLESSAPPVESFAQLNLEEQIELATDRAITLTLEVGKCSVDAWATVGELQLMKGRDE